VFHAGGPVPDPHASVHFGTEFMISQLARVNVASRFDRPAPKSDRAARPAVLVAKIVPLAVHIRAHRIALPEPVTPL
jgi:hypothetical protein